MWVSTPESARLVESRPNTRPRSSHDFQRGFWPTFCASFLLLGNCSQSRICQKVELDVVSAEQLALQMRDIDITRDVGSQDGARNHIDVIVGVNPITGLSRTAVVGSASRSASIRLGWRKTHWPAAARRLQERRHSVSPETFGGAPTRCCWGRVRGTLWAYEGQTELDDTHQQHCASIRNATKLSGPTVTNSTSWSSSV